jgi:hypothetical protein
MATNANAEPRQIPDTPHLRSFSLDEILSNSWHLRLSFPAARNVPARTPVVTWPSRDQNGGFGAANRPGLRNIYVTCIFLQCSLLPARSIAANTLDQRCD